MVGVFSLDILLVYYEVPRYESHSFLSRFPIGLFALSSYISSVGYSPGVWSGTSKELSQLLKIIESKRPKIIGFHLHYDNFFDVLYLCRKLKKEYPETKFIAGGPQAYVVDEEDFFLSGLDVVVLGEGEYPLFRLCQYYIDNFGKLSEIPGLKYMEGEKITITEETFILPNLEALPIPQFEHALYPLNLSFYPISSGRGCPFRCAFCYEGYNKHKKVRFRTIESIKAELENVFKSYNPKYLIFVDDTFTLNRSRLIDIANLLKFFRNKHDFVWFCEAHVKSIMLYEDVLPSLFESGLSRIQLGIESGDDRVLKLYNKHSSRALIEKSVSVIVEKDPLCCQIVGNFILGGPEENNKSVENSLKLAESLLELAPVRVELSPVFLSLYPFTPLTQNPSFYGLKTLEDKKGKLVWNSMREPVAETNSFSKTDLLKIYKEFNDFLEQKMTSLIDTVSKDVLKEQYKLFFRYDIYSKWIYIINSNFPHIYRYFSFIFEHNFKEISKFSLDDIVNIRPLRTVSMSVEYEKKIFDFQDLEKKVFELCTGKLTLKDISYFANIDIYNLVKILKKLAAKYLIVGIN